MTITGNGGGTQDRIFEPTKIQIKRFIYQDRQRIFDQVALVLFAQTMRMLGTRVLRQCLLRCMARLCLQLRCGERGRWGKWGGYSCLYSCFQSVVVSPMRFYDVIWYVYVNLHMYVVCYLFGEILFHPVLGEHWEDTTPIQAKRVLFIYFFSGWTLMATAGLWASS